MAPDRDAPESGRLSFFLPSFHAGGAERVALVLIEWFLQRGYEVDLVLARAEGELLELVPGQVTVIDLNARRLRSTILPFARYLRERRPLSVQAFMWPLTCAAIIARRLSGSKSRLAVSDHTTLSKDRAHFTALWRGVLRQSIRRLYPLADARIMVSAQAADDLACFTGIARDSLTVIYNPIARPTQTARAADDLWVGKGVRILTVGKLKPAKNHALLLEAFATFARSREAQLMIVGEGELRNELLRQATDLGIADRLHMPGLALDPAPFYASADLFVLSSDYEGYGLVLVEALFNRLRVVSTDCPSGPREILDDGRYGRLVPVGDAAALADAMIAALNDPSAPEVARRRAEELTAGGCEAHEHAMGARR